MTKIKHHLTDALLMGYAAGNLPEAFNLVCASHISMCDDCRAALAAFDAVGGVMIDDGDCAALDVSSLAATLAKIVDLPQDRPQSAAPKGVFPSPLQAYVNGDVDAVKWRRIGGGVSQMILSSAKGASVRLLKIPAGAAVPDHGHRGTELTLVLQGAFADDSDHFGIGDIEVANQDMVHTPTAQHGQDCICLAATDAPLVFNDIMPRLMQRFVRI